MLTATLLLAAVLAVGGALSLRAQRRPIPLVEDARRVLRGLRVESTVTRIATVVLVVSAVVILLFLL
jgi:hypothetical protein